jgi:hypothetical protein
MNLSNKKTIIEVKKMVTAAHNNLRDAYAPIFTFPYSNSNDYPRQRILLSFVIMSD